MNEPANVEIALRIPGKWSGPEDLISRLPTGCQLTPETLTLPDGASFDFGAGKADDQFAQIFRSSCRQPPTDEELAIVDSYEVNVFLCGPGGSLDAARNMMQAAAAIVRAGGAGVFIDNSGLAHGGTDWLAMTEDGGPDALSYAFVAIVGGRKEAWTMGMHILGLRDILMKSTDAQQEEFGMIDVIRYMCQSEKPIEDGHVLADLNGPRFQVALQGSDPRFAGSPMDNPFGRLKLVSVRDIAASN